MVLSSNGCPLHEHGRGRQGLPVFVSKRLFDWYLVGMKCFLAMIAGLEEKIPVR